MYTCVYHQIFFFIKSFIYYFGFFTFCYMWTFNSRITKEEEHIYVSIWLLSEKGYTAFYRLHWNIKYIFESELQTCMYNRYMYKHKCMNEMYAKGCGWLEMFFFSIYYSYIYKSTFIYFRMNKKGLFSKWWW